MSATKYAQEMYFNYPSLILEPQQVLIEALKAGYNVRAAVRSQSKAEKILAMPSIQAIKPQKRLEFVIIPDMVADGAYAEAIKGASYAIHVASSIPQNYTEGEDFSAFFNAPALKGTLGILEAAQKTNTVKRIVITSSVGGIIDITKDDLVNEKSRVPSNPGPHSNPFVAYLASKVNALNAAEAWVEKEKPRFDVVHIWPGYVIGHNELVTESKDVPAGSNMVVVLPVTGRECDPTPNSSISLEDTARAHVLALDPKIPGNRGYLLHCGGLEGTTWEQARDIVAREFKDEVANGLLPNNGKVVTLKYRIDSSESQEVLGFKYQNFETQVKDIIGQYVELKSSELKAGA
jgi:nucleoside-diphosphate-sugar epimerase